MTHVRRCAACRGPLPETARSNQRFCTSRCRERARKRLKRGGPEADPTPHASTATSDPLIPKLDRQIAGKERTIARLRAGRQADRDRARAAEVAVRAETARAERAIAAIGKDQHDQRREIAGLTEQLAQAQDVAAGKDQAIADLTAAVQAYRADAEQRAAAERKVPTQLIRKQWEALAVRIARQASGSAGMPLAGLDQEVVSTWQRLRQQTPAAGTATTAARPNRPTRPTTPPRRRNR